MPAVLRDLERLKPQIEASYQEWLNTRAARKDAGQSQKRLSNYENHAANDPALSWNTTSRARVLDAKEHQDVALKLAKQEIRRRHAVRRAEGGPGLTDEEERSRRSAGVWDSWDVPANAYASDDAGPADDLEMRRHMEATRRMALHGADGRIKDEREARRPASHSYQYPTLQKSTSVAYEPSIHADRLRESRIAPPPIPSKEILPPSPPAYRFASPAPALPQKAIAPRHGSITPEPVPELPPKVPAVSAKNERTVFQPAAYLENGEPLRTVFLPANLRRTFLEIAADNTRRGLEMCGILCGTPVNNALFISCLLIPEQKCTSDTCETENESSMLEFCIERDLLVLGWIHTHPTQTCFMSSRDLHTQAGYQVMMPEALAIVCAPRHTPS
jgi:STAM-binding protein